MKTIIIIVLLLLLVFIVFASTNKPSSNKTLIKENVVPRYKPVYIDPPTSYLNEPILYSEWDQEISSSL